jgi:fatty acid desaturase
MEVIFEMLFDLIIDGSIEICGNKKAPFIVRIVTAMILLVIYVGIICSLVYIGALNKQPIVIIVAVVIFALCSILIVKKFCQLKKKKDIS